MHLIKNLFTYTIIFYILIFNPVVGILLLILCHMFLYKTNKYSILLLLLLLFSTFTSTYYQPINSNEILITIEENLEVNEEYVSFETSIKYDKYQVYIYGNNLNFEYGDTISSNSYTIEKVENTYNNPSSFDYEKYMKGNSTNYVISFEDYEVTENESKIRYSLKNRRLDNINYNIENVKHYEYINALVYGENNFEDEQYDVFAELNIIHALTISGSHLVILISFTRLFLSYFKIQLTTINRILLIILPIYCVLAGGSIPIIRASVLEMVIILCNNKFNRLEITMVIFIVFCILNPFVVHLVSFQLTFLMSFALFFIDSFLTSKNPIIKALQMSFWLSYFILPITINMNYEINFLAPLANIILVPLISTIILPLCFLNELAPLITNIFPWLLNISVIIFEAIATLFAKFTMITGQITWLYGIFMLFCALLYVYHKKQMYYITCIALVLFLPININIIGSVNFVDVGQGDCIYIQLPLNQGNILVDTGPTDAEDEILQYLKYYGVRTIDMMFLTHNHADHNGNAQIIYDSIKVKNVYGPVGSSKNLPVTEIKAGDIIYFKGYSFEILYPYEVSENPNSNSLVIQTKLGLQTYLFTGDIEYADEQYLVQNYDLNSTILKIPHHGSKTSSSTTFIDNVSPNMCVIQVGEDNMYNHPSPQTLETLNGKCEIIQTDDAGEIKFHFIALSS